MHQKWIVPITQAGRRSFARSCVIIGGHDTLIRAHGHGAIELSGQSVRNEEKKHVMKLDAEFFLSRTRLTPGIEAKTDANVFPRFLAAQFEANRHFHHHLERQLRSCKSLTYNLLSI